MFPGEGKLVGEENQTKSTRTRLPPHCGFSPESNFARFKVFVLLLFGLFAISEMLAPWRRKTSWGRKIRQNQHQPVDQNEIKWNNKPRKVFSLQKQKTWQNTGCAAGSDGEIIEKIFLQIENIPLSLSLKLLCPNCVCSTNFSNFFCFQSNSPLLLCFHRCREILFSRSRFHLAK